jgi:hypothetical protein
MLAHAYQLLLLAAAAAPRNRSGPARRPRGVTRFAVVVPAHNEEAAIARTLESLEGMEYPRERFRTIVVADNCTDGTARVARSAGATVLERDAPDEHGKGHALAWALERLGNEFDAVVVLDADCEASPNLLGALEAGLTRGNAAVQASNRAANPEQAPMSALRFAAFSLQNHVRPLGRDRLGLSCGLLGTGMALESGLLRRCPWAAFTLTEDADYHLGLVAAGERVQFAPEAVVRSPMPTSLVASRVQRLRWESGRWTLARAWAWRLFVLGARSRDVRRLHAGLELLVPPASLLMAGNVATLLVARGVRSRKGLVVAAGNSAAQLAYVLGGLHLVGAPRPVYRALLLAPLLAIDSLLVHARIAAGRGPTRWIRSQRQGAAR